MTVPPESCYDAVWSVPPGTGGAHAEGEMMRNRLTAGFTALLLAVLTLLGAARPVLAAGTYAASTIKVAGTEGTVTAKDRKGNSLPMKTGNRLTSGCTVSTAADSYAWLNLDDTKALKLDADTEILITKYKTNLDVTVNKGSVFFDVSQKLDAEENFHIRSANMVMGIRGTIGYVTKTGNNTAMVAILEGDVHVQVTDEVTGIVTEGNVTAGQIVDTDALASQGRQQQGGQNGVPGALTYRKITRQLIPDYILADVASGNNADGARTRFTQGSDVLSGRIFDACGIDLRGVTPEEVPIKTELPDIKEAKKKSYLEACIAFDEELKRLAREEEEKRIAAQASEDDDEEEEDNRPRYAIDVFVSTQSSWTYTISPSGSAPEGTVVTITGIGQNGANGPNITVYENTSQQTVIASQACPQGSTTNTLTFTMPAQDVYIYVG